MANILSFRAMNPPYVPTVFNIALVANAISTNTTLNSCIDTKSVLYLFLGAHTRSRVRDEHTEAVNVILAEMRKYYTDICTQERKGTIIKTQIIIRKELEELVMLIEVYSSGGDCRKSTYNIDQDDVKAFLMIVTDNCINIHDIKSNPYFIYDS